MHTAMQTPARKVNRWLTFITTTLFIAAVPHSTLAEKHDGLMENHGSHQHGMAHLTLATTQDELEIALASPAVNLFGFEHEAKSDEERAIVQTALKKLKNGTQLFDIDPAAACSLKDVHIKSSILQSQNTEKQAEHGSHAKNDNHAHVSQANRVTSHSDVEAIWIFHCDHPETIDKVDIKLFSTFPGSFDEIAVEWLTATDAEKFELPQDGNTILQS